jgi:hypothetical protein
MGTVVMASTQGKEAKGFDYDHAVSDLFLRPTENEKEARNDSRLQSISSQFKSSDARLFCNSIGALPDIRVEFDKPESLNKAMLELNSSPGLEFDKQPIAPWTPNRKLTAEQVRLRRLLRVLTENEEKLPWLADLKPIVEASNEAALESAETAQPKSNEEQAKLNEARRAELDEKKLQWIKAGLSRSSGETKKMIEAYLRYDAAFKSAIERSKVSGEDFPALHEYLADSAVALGYVDSSAPEYRFGARVNAFPDLQSQDRESDLDQQAFSTNTNVTEANLIISISGTMDSCAAYNAIAQWLFQQGAATVSIGYQKLELLEDKQASAK